MGKRHPQHKPKKAFSPQSGLGFAFQLSAELISGILVGLLIGYAIDHVFNTQPWGLVVMVLLGSAAGILTIFRTLGIGGGAHTRKTPSKPRNSQNG